jgi:hypothetical protein
MKRFKTLADLQKAAKCTGLRRLALRDFISNFYPAFLDIAGKDKSCKIADDAFSPLFTRK